jgi:RNA polymerase sigma factor (sigma-70 family)
MPNMIYSQHSAPFDDANAALAARSDEQLVALLRQGSHSAFEILAARYQKRLLCFCWKILRSKEDAEDALQDVFASAFRALLADDRDIYVRPWLYRIARNRCITELRRSKAIRVDQLSEHQAENGRTLVEKLAGRQQFHELVEDVQALPETQRTALLLREIDGFAYEQIATAMDTTVSAVKSLLVRARAGLREASTARDSGPIATPRARTREQPCIKARRATRAISYQTARSTASPAR